MPLRRRVVLLCALLLLAPWTNAQADNGASAQYCSLLPALEADGERANASVAWQVGLGPRLPGSHASAALLDGFEENHSGWSFTRDTHTYAGGTLTNLVAVYPPNTDLATTDALGLGAHYDSREFADFEENATNASLPVPGANDGGSGVGAVGELMRIIPSMNLDHAVVVVLFDAEDQGTYTDKESWAEGSRRWADNLTSEEVSHLKAFILLDMIGDEYLNLANISSNDDTLNAGEVDADVGAETRVVRAVDAVHATSPVLRPSLARASPSQPPGGRGARRVVLVVIGIVQPVLPPAVLALAGHVDARAPSSRRSGRPRIKEKGLVHLSGRG